MTDATTPPSAIQNLDELRQRLRSFSAARNWTPFHSPKNLAMALSVEVAELLEHFQWLTEAQSRALPATTQQAVTHEAADVLIYLVELADVLGINLLQAAQDKMALNALKYPAELPQGGLKLHRD